MELDSIFELGSMFLEFEKNVLKSNPKTSKIEKTELKTPPREFQNKFHNVKNMIKSSLKKFI
jgi:hypothetical protein